MDQIGALFDNLDLWRHYPDYQLERRVDIFFSLYLHEILEEKLNVKIIDEFIPEFPIQKKLIDKKSNMSYKIDYFTMTADGTTPIFVELKTDDDSRNKDQDDYLNEARNTGLVNLLKGIKEISLVTSSKQKYFKFFKQLEKMNLVQIPESLEQLMKQTSLIGYKKKIQEIMIIANPSKNAEILYIQPNGKEKNIINFQEIAKIIERHTDPVSRRFVQSLRKWAQIKA